MKYFLLFLLTLLAGGSAWAQSPDSRGGAVSQTGSEQRRAELRLALKAPTRREPQERERVPEEKPADRHLSAQERESLRQQLRLQRRDARTD
jgi:hypothetical protein